MNNKWIKNHLWLGLNCLVPVYGKGDDAGNYTEVWLEDGQKILDRRRTKTVLKALASYLGASWQQQATAWSGENRRLLSPIVLGPDMVLVPLRLRQPRSKDEGGTGYVVQNKVIRWEEHEEGPYRTRLHLKGEQILPCLLSIDTLELRLLSGEKALRTHKEIFKGIILTGCRVYEHSPHLLVEPDGSTTPVKVLDRQGNLIVLRQENKRILR